MVNATEQFRAAIVAAGINPPDMIEADGRLRGFASNGKRGDDSGWYTLHADGIPAGAFGCWRSDLSQAWRMDIGRKLSAVEHAAHAERVQKMREQRETDTKARHAEAARKAAELWKAATPAGADHPYLARKGVKAHGIRVHDGALVVPMRDAAGEAHSLQFIAPDGDKRFLPGGKVAGCYFSIGTPAGIVCIAEGVATAASIHEATGYAAAVAFNAGNLEAVARAAREAAGREHHPVRRRRLPHRRQSWHDEGDGGRARHRRITGRSRLRRRPTGWCYRLQRPAPACRRRGR